MDRYQRWIEIVKATKENYTKKEQTAMKHYRKITQYIHKIRKFTANKGGEIGRANRGSILFRSTGVYFQNFRIDTITSIVNFVSDAAFDVSSVCLNDSISILHNYSYDTSSIVFIDYGNGVSDTVFANSEVIPVSSKYIYPNAGIQQN